MEVSVCFRNHTYTNCTWIHSQTVIKKHNPPVQKCTLTFGDLVKGVMSVSVFQLCCEPNDRAAAQDDSRPLDRWDVNERRAGLSPGNEPLIPCSHESGASGGHSCLWELQYNTIYTAQRDPSVYVYFLICIKFTKR